MKTYIQIKAEVIRMIRSIKYQNKEVGQHLESGIIFDDKNETVYYMGEEGVELVFDFCLTVD